MHQKAREILTRLDVQIDPRATLKTLSIAQRHMVAIARALSFEAQVVILDEPPHSPSTRFWSFIKSLNA